MKTGKSNTTAIPSSREEQSKRVPTSASTSDLRDDMATIRLRWAALPERDTRTADDIIGYDESGLPH